MVQLLANLAATLASHALYANIRHTRLGEFLVAANRFNQMINKSNDRHKDKKTFLQTQL